MCDDFAHPLFLIGEKNRIAYLCRDTVRYPHTNHAMFRATAIADAGYDFLARVTAFVKTHRIDQIKIQSLGDKSLTGFVGDSRIAGTNFQ